MSETQKDALGEVVEATVPLTELAAMRKALVQMYGMVRQYPELTTVPLVCEAKRIFDERYAEWMATKIGTAEDPFLKRS